MYLLIFFFIWIFFSVDDGKEDRIELENLLKIDDLEKLRLHGFVCQIFKNKFLIFVFSVI